MCKIDTPLAATVKALYQGDAFDKIKLYSRGGRHADVTDEVPVRIYEDVSDEGKRTSVPWGKDDVEAGLSADNNGIAHGKAIEERAEMGDGGGEAFSDDADVTREDVRVADVVVQRAFNLLF